MLILLVGLPGSGKTWYAQNVLEYDYFVDDPKGFFDFPRDVNDDDVVVIADPMLCVSKARAKSILPTMYPGHEIKWIFFENNPEKAAKNVEYRAKNGDNRDVRITAQFLSKLYIVPNDVKTIPIWSPENEKND